MDDATHDTLEQLYYRLVLGTDDPAQAVEQLAAIVDDVLDMIDTVAIFGLDAAADVLHPDFGVADWLDTAIAVSREA